MNRLASLIVVWMICSIAAQQQCTTGVSDCRVDPCACQNGGSCVAPDYKTCSCMTQFTGYAGDYCQIPQCDDMSRFPYGCRAGVCVAPNTCNCNGTGFTGVDCNTPVCETPCKNGRCTGPNTCDCEGTGYAGSLCEIPQCLPPCENGGTCIGPNQCDCTTTPPRRGGQQGYNGTQCEFPICDPPCKNSGKCSGPNQCACEGTGFAGPLCDYDENECLREQTPCDSRTTCTNTVGGFQCSPCPAGLYGSPYLSRGGCTNTPPTNPATTQPTRPTVQPTRTSPQPTSMPSSSSASSTEEIPVSTTEKSNNPPISGDAEAAGVNLIPLCSLLIFAAATLLVL